MFRLETIWPARQPTKHSTYLLRDPRNIPTNNIAFLRKPKIYLAYNGRWWFSGFLISDHLRDSNLESW